MLVLVSPSSTSSGTSRTASPSGRRPNPRSSPSSRCRCRPGRPARCSGTGTTRSAGTAWAAASRPTTAGRPRPTDPPPPDPDRLAPGFEHFKCWRVTNAGEKLRRGILAEVEDQFGRQKVELRRPVGFCALATKNGEPIRDANRHLVCYSIRRLIKRPAPIATVLTTNQFGREFVDVVREQQLCVPAAKLSVQIP